MQTQNYKLDFTGQNIYVGIDTHLKNWKATIMLDDITHKTFSQEPDVKKSELYLRRNFPGGNYLSAYEASFCGFNIHRELHKHGIKNIVVNPADIPVTDKEKKQKEDKRDSRKIAKALRSGDLEAIYVPARETEEDRSLVRYRRTLVKEINRHKHRVKSLLYYYGITISQKFSSGSKHWSKQYSSWLREIKFETSSGEITLNKIIYTVEYLRKQLLETTFEIKKLSQQERYIKNIKFLTNIPGIGLITAMIILTELENIIRFKNLDKLSSCVGLIPTTNSTGDNDKVGDLTCRSNKYLRSIIVESSWIAVRIDPALMMVYTNLCKRMKPSEAIIRIAKKLLNRIRYVLKNKLEYEFAIVK
ncbi:MAG: IS110 family transposase [Bacteroidales bacterium]|nr:IS110 family transposase [Bacteroidales bacterium]